MTRSSFLGRPQGRAEDLEPGSRRNSCDTEVQEAKPFLAQFSQFRGPPLAEVEQPSSPVGGNGICH